MNRLIVIAFVTLLLSACHSRPAREQSAPPAVAITFADTLHDLGTLPADSAQKAYTFRFTNTGTVPVAVVSVSLSCHCLSATYTRTLVRPGEQGEVTLLFDGSHAAPGYFDKSARVRFNGTRVQQLRVKGWVESPVGAGWNR